MIKYGDKELLNIVWYCHDVEDYPGVKIKDLSIKYIQHTLQDLQTEEGRHKHTADEGWIEKFERVLELKIIEERLKKLEMVI